MNNLWSENHPRKFWQTKDNFPEAVWQQAITLALPLLELDHTPVDIDEILSMTLGEGRFGPDHWDLGPMKKVYYLLKPLIPKTISHRLRQFYNRSSKPSDNWLIEHRYVDFLWEVMRQVLVLSNQEKTFIQCFWPKHQCYAFILTHDVETGEGQAFVEEVADLEESLGFRSSFNFVPYRYQIDSGLMNSLHKRGFEIGVHGFKHNGRLFNNQQSFYQKAQHINTFLSKWGASGFRSELTLRQPEWMQRLEIQYDLSFFDVDPFEPIPGGTMCIWPFSIGRFIELPYTLIQDNTLISILNQKDPQYWLTKIEFIEKYHGSALVNTHPDYLKSRINWEVYVNFLKAMQERNNYWHALPGDAARWWKTRTGASPENELKLEEISEVTLVNGTIKIRP